VGGDGIVLCDDCNGSYVPVHVTNVHGTVHEHTEHMKS
jgi:hypothetical protein